MCLILTLWWHLGLRGRVHVSVIECGLLLLLLLIDKLLLLSGHLLLLLLLLLSLMYVLVFLDSLHKSGHMLENDTGVGVDAAGQLGDRLKSAVLVAEVSEHELVQARRRIDHVGADGIACELGEQTGGGLLVVHDGREEHLHEERDAVEFLHENLILMLLGQDEQCAGAGVHDVKQVHVLDLDHHAGVGLHAEAVVGTSLALGERLEQHLHELLDESAGAQVSRVELIGAQVAHEAE